MSKFEVGDKVTLKNATAIQHSAYEFCADYSKGLVLFQLYTIESAHFHSDGMWYYILEEYNSSVFHPHDIFIRVASNPSSNAAPAVVTMSTKLILKNNNRAYV